MWLKIRSLKDYLWASKSEKEQRQFLVSLLLGIISLLTLALSLDFGRFLEIARIQILPIAQAAITNNKYMLIASICSAAGSIYLFYHSMNYSLIKNLNLSEDSVPRHRIEEKVEFCETPEPLVETEKLKLDEEYFESGYKIIRLCLPRKKTFDVALSEDVNKALVSLESSGKGDEIKFEIAEDENWTPEGIGLELLPYAIGRNPSGIAFNGEKLRLSTDLLLTADGLPRKLEVHKTKYFYSLSTNELSYVKIFRQGTGTMKDDNEERVDYDGTQFFVRDNTLKKLGNSTCNCSNHVGVSTIAITSDNQIILVKQSSRNLQNSGLLMTSGSGSVDWSDVKKQRNKSFLAIIRQAAERELIEECGLDPKRVTLKTYVIGFARLINRGGKPEFFCVTKINRTVDQMIQNHTLEEKHFTAKTLPLKIDENNVKNSVIKNIKLDKYQYSIQLALALNFIDDAIKNNREIKFAALSSS